MKAWRKVDLRIVILVIILIPSVILNILLLAKNPQKDPGVAVIGVIDGDTLVLEGKTRLRLRHVDAPEMEYCGGKEAKKELESLVKGKTVRLAEQVPDQRGRGMALVYIGDFLVNEKMLESGWVRYHHDISSKTEILKAASQKAKLEETGIFGKCQSKVNTDNPGCIIKGNIDKGNNVKKYYIPGCAQYEFTLVEKDIGEDWFCTEKEAQKAGFVKADTCRER